MGTMKNKKNERSARRSRSTITENQGVANWALAEAAQLQYTLLAVASHGGALRLGYSRDGGAYSIGIYGDGEPYTEYVRPQDDINAYLVRLAEDFGNVTGDGSFVGE